MTAWGYEFYLLVLIISLTRSLRAVLEDKISIPAWPCNIPSLFFFIFYFFFHVLERPIQRKYKCLQTLT